MSIRLRLTLLYSAILALTLIVFSAILYAIQSQATWNALQATLARQAEEYALTERRMPMHPDLMMPAMMPSRGRWTQLRNPDGTVIARTPDLGDTTLPLSDAGLRAAQGGKAWLETAQVEGEPLLIYSQPVVVQDQIVRIVQIANPIAEREQALTSLRLILAATSGLAILAAFAIGWWLAGITLRPIHQIAQTAQAIGAERDFSRRVQHAGPNDEIGQLATTFNTMLTELESAYRQVERSLQAQRRFVADASHELRTPLTTIRGNIELLRHDTLSDAAERNDILTDTQHEIERLIRLVNQLLLLARADASRTLRGEPLPIQPLLDDVCRQVALLAPHRTIRCDTPADVTALGDSDALKQVLLILVDNALKHTPAHATISLTAARTDAHVTISVRDTGPGIAPDLLPHIFERFFRADASRSGGGAGLGLAIAKELVEAQGGTLSVSSREGQGSVFTITLLHADLPIVVQIPA